MSKMNNEEMEQLLKDLAANVGYDLISAPFDTPFTKESIEMLPDNKQFFWTVPTSVLNSKEYEEFRKLCISVDIIDTVCTTSFPWPSDEEDRVGILLIDLTRKRRGSIKFVYADEWDISNEDKMAGVCNMLIHDLFPGQDLLAFQMNEDLMDEGLDFMWNNQVYIFAACDVNSLLPSDYFYKPGLYNYAENMCLIGDIFDICDNLSDNDIARLKKPAILLSTVGKLCPQIIEPENREQIISLDNKMLLIPDDCHYNVDLPYALQLFTKEDVLRQLPITRKITYSDMWRVQIERNGLYEERTISIEELMKKIEEKENNGKS